MLAVAGNLNLKMGGPGFDLFDPNDNYVKVYNSRTKFGSEEWRRMVYQANPRMQLESTFGAFDCPDAGQTAPRRTSSVTPLQALNLLEQPVHFAAGGVARETNRARSERRRAVERAFELALNRSVDNGRDDARPASSCMNTA
jgi:hypothetical protein